MTSKTIALSGAEIRADYSGGTNAWLRNDGTATVYASTAPAVTPGADGVVSIPAGQAAAIYGACGGVYLLGTGSVQLVGSDYTACPFKTSAQGGGSGADSVARAAIEAHAGNADIHVTAAEKSAWDGLSNPNLLINPDFRVNQRGQNEYSTGYTVDRWYSPGKCSAAPISGGVKLTSTVTASSTTHAFWQNFEFPLPPGKYTLSLKAADVTGVWAARIRTVTAAGDYVDSYYTPRLQAGINSVTVDLSDSEYISAVSIGFNKGTEAGNSLKLAWAKLEGGSLATPFVPPDYAAELAKCQRFYQVRTTNDIDPLDMRPSMRTITDIKAVEGGYAYVAEL
jgi:hypothetical protein|nr:MAG TPA: tail fiber protein [Caudoviricetes sp.]